MSFLVKELRQVPVDEQPLELVERKGKGHPDYICDAVMNEVSVALSKEYIRRFDTVMHHNIDKGLLAAGSVERKLGGGFVKKPILMVFGDRATYDVDGKFVPVDEIAVKTAKSWFRRNLRFVDPDRHVRYQVELAPGSQALRDLFKRKASVLGANDTSAAVGYAPMTRTEKIVFDLERFLNSASFKKSYPETGEDVKVMGLRTNHKIELTVAMAFVDRFIESESQYFKRKGEVLQEIGRFVKNRYDGGDIKVYLNTLDRRGRGLGGMYLTVLGTSADDGDGGQVGRGNRVNGVIPLNRPTCSEAAAGKNPVSHVGKIYNLLSYRMADRIIHKVSGIREVYVWLLSQIGQPINKPMVASAEIIPEKSARMKDLLRPVKNVMAEELKDIEEFSKELAYGKIPVC